MKKAYQFRIYPTKKQEVELGRTLSTCKHLYNDSLAERKRNAKVKNMKFKKVYMLIFMALLFSGCIENIGGRFMKVPVVYVNVTVGSENNTTFIQDITATGGEISRLNYGAVLPEKFPAIYVEILQIYNISKSEALKTISLSNGQEFKGTGNYSFKVTLIENSLNKSQPVFVYSEIISANKTRIARAEAKVNWSES